MSTMKKRIPMFLLALAMMVAMALPTFAASYRPNVKHEKDGSSYPYSFHQKGQTICVFDRKAKRLCHTGKSRFDCDNKSQSI